MSKTFVRAALLGLAAIIATSSMAEASYGWRVAKIKNETSVDMYSVFIRRADFDSWGPDLLGDYVQTPGTRQTYKAVSSAASSTSRSSSRTATRPISGTRTSATTTGSTSRSKT